MKKIIAVFCVVTMLLSIFAVTASASPKDDILACIDANVPADIVSAYRTQAVNILNQFDVTEEKASQVNAVIVEAAPTLKAGATSLSEYTEEERDYLLDAFNRVLVILGLTYKIVEKKNPKHAGDHAVALYDASGKLVAELDGDPVNDTGAASENHTALIVLLSVLAVAVAVALGYGVKKTAVRV